MWGRIVQWLGFPPMVAEVDVMEGGQQLRIRTSPRYTIIQVNGATEFFFDRESGKYDGFGEMHKDSA